MIKAMSYCGGRNTGFVQLEVQGRLLASVYSRAAQLQASFMLLKPHSMLDEMYPEGSYKATVNDFGNSLHFKPKVTFELSRGSHIIVFSHEMTAYRFDYLELSKHAETVAKADLVE